jgi:hypothetical protein
MAKLAETRDPKYWEDRAEEILVRLEETKGEGPRRILWRIYGDYLRLAALAGGEPNIDVPAFEEVNFGSSQALRPSRPKG